MFTETEQAWIDRTAAHPVPVAVTNPDWRGVSSSARELFDEVYLVPDTLDEPEAARLAALFAEAGCTSLVVQAFPETYRHLIRAVRRAAPHISISILWHASFIQARRDFDWEMLMNACREVDDGQVARIGFVKRGMAEVFATKGYRTAFVPNRVRRIPQAASTPLAAGPHLGIWVYYDTWRKAPHAMLAAARLVPGATLHTGRLFDSVRRFTDFLNLPRHVDHGEVGPPELARLLPAMTLNLAVTLTECAPMLPLESLSLGTPCLLGPNSPYFEDEPYLHSRLVVREPDDSAVIREAIDAAVGERDRIIAAYRDYAVDYNARVQKSVDEFLHC